MLHKALAILFILATAGTIAGQTTQRQKVNVVTFWAEQQFDEVAPGDNSAIAIHFELEDGWHFYASADTAPGGMNLKFDPNEQVLRVFSFSKPIFPKADWLFDEALGKKVEVIGGKFTVYLPFKVAADAPQPQTVIVDIGIEGAVCTESQCRVPDFGRLTTEIKISKDANNPQPKFVLPQRQPPPGVAGGFAGQWGNLSIWVALSLAFLAGLLLNVMPCVWPVLPIIIMRLVENAKESKGKSFTMGLAFCIGLLLFFACLAGANIILKLTFGITLQWGDQFRIPAFLTGMILLLVILALFMFGVFTVSLPSSIAAKSGSGRGLAGAVGMGFLAAILSTPCSFAILALAFSWALAQPLGLATIAIMVIGIGMAMPYAVLSAIPSLLKKTPRPGRWMELLKQTIGFVLLAIAVKLIAALPGERRIGVLYYSVILGFCIWMWGSWVSFSTALVKKWVIRIIAVILAISSGLVFLSVPKPSLIDWQKYDQETIGEGLKENRPVLIDFTAKWCLSCAVVDKTVYSRKDIADLIKQKDVLAINADTTTLSSPAATALKDIYNEPGIPVAILLVPGSEPMRWRGIAFGDDLKSALENLPQNTGK